MLAATDPTESLSVLAFESVPRPDDLTAEDQTSIGTDEHAVYYQSVPGKSYAVGWSSSLDGGWWFNEVVTATTTQKRFVFPKGGGGLFFRLMLAQ
jgi:hypothetical protein